MKKDWCNIRVSIPWRDYSHFRDTRLWLINTIDERDWDFDGIDDNNLENRIYYFARQKDAMMFTLIWS
jgi:hypothetical protein